MPGRNNGAQDRADVLRAKERRAKALAMRVRGYDIPTIKEKLGFTTVKHTRREILKASRESFAQEDKQEAISLELQRLDKAVLSAMKVMGGVGVDPHARMKAIDSLVKVSERRSSFMGLDARPGDGTDDSDVDTWLNHIAGTEMNDSTPEADDIEDDEPDDLDSEDDGA